MKKSTSFSLTLSEMSTYGALWSYFHKPFPAWLKKEGGDDVGRVVIDGAEESASNVLYGYMWGVIPDGSDQSNITRTP